MRLCWLIPIHCGKRYSRSQSLCLFDAPNPLESGLSEQSWSVKNHSLLDHNRTCCGELATQEVKNRPDFLSKVVIKKKPILIQYVVTLDFQALQHHELARKAK